MIMMFYSQKSLPQNISAASVASQFQPELEILPLPTSSLAPLPLALSVGTDPKTKPTKEVRSN